MRLMYKKATHTSSGPNPVPRWPLSPTWHINSTTSEVEKAAFTSSATNRTSAQPNVLNPVKPRGQMMPCLVKISRASLASEATWRWNGARSELDECAEFWRLAWMHMRVPLMPGKCVRNNGNSSMQIRRDRVFPFPEQRQRQQWDTRAHDCDRWPTLVASHCCDDRTTWRYNNKK